MLFSNLCWGFLSGATMPRKPAHLELAGGKGARQRAWEAIRACRGEEWTRAQIASRAKVDPATLESYLQGLTKAGVITEVRRQESAGKHRGACAGVRWYVLAQDRGVEAPRITRDGREVAQGRGIENMWQAIRNFLPVFDHREIVAYASTADVPVSEHTAKSFVLALAAAGYLEEIAPAKVGRGHTAPARYRLLPHMNTGPRPPMIQRTKTVYDPNLGRVVWQEQPDFDGEASHA